MTRGIHFVAVALLATVFVGCAPAVGGGWMLALAVVAAALLGMAPLDARADAPPATSTPGVDYRAARPPGPPPPRPPCDGWEHKSCRGGNIAVSCCPKNARCNYAYAPFVECGNGSCVPGKDRGRCPEKVPMTQPGVSKEKCDTYHWQKVCLNNKVTEACIMPVPTNYMGPPRNPPFKRCSDQRCTTTDFRAACYPTKAETSECGRSRSWRKVCLMGKVEERCLPRPPTNFSGTFYPATQFVECPDKTCVVGTDKNDCR